MVRGVAWLLCIATLVTACQSAVPPRPTESVSLAPTASATASAAASASAKVPVGGTLRVGVGTPVTLDPRATDTDPLIAGQIFEGLVTRGPAGPAPALATKWVVGPDGRAWTFTLRDAVVFHDGSTADGPAVARSFTRSDDAIIERAEAPDPRTVVLTTRVPYGPFLSALALPAYAVVGPASRLSGTGPFRVPTGGEGARPLVLERNDRYWGADAAGQRLPYLDRLSFTALPDPAVRLGALRTGSVDVITDLAVSDIGAVRTDPSLQLVARPETTILYLGLNLSDPAAGDLRVRQAVAQAVSGRSLVDRLYGGAATPASQLLLPEMLGFDTSVVEFAKSDAAAAKKLLLESGHAGIALEIWYQLGGPATAPEMRRVVEALAGDLAAAGVSVEPKTIDPVTFDVGVRENRYPAWLGLAAPASFDPADVYAAFVPPVINGQDQPTLGGSWSNREVAGLLRRARDEPDQSKRAELYKQVTKIVQREIPRIPLVWSGPLAAATKKIVDPRGALFAGFALGK